MLTKWWRRGLVALIAGGLMGMAWFGLQVYPLGGSGRPVSVTVHPGDSIATIANELHAAGVLASPFAFRLDVLLEGSLLVRPGTYVVRQGASFSSIRSILGSSPNVLQVVPGLTLREISAQVAGIAGTAYANQFDALVARDALASPFAGPRSLEGEVGPGSYAIVSGVTPAVLLADMEANFAKELAAQGLTPESRVEGLTAYQLLTAASIVEKEGYYVSNMSRVARVILNRLARGQALQMDSTVLYALHRDGGTVTPAMLRTETPYNTYLHAGLTPTPICVVSADALHAILHPAAGSWLYFVLVNKNGEMAFSTTYAQQLANEALAASRGV